VPGAPLHTDYRAILNRRLAIRGGGQLDVQTKLKHFALINYALPASRLAAYIPTDQYEIPEFSIGGQQLALMSAVPFVDIDFHFTHLFPWLTFHFGQTNYRVYVIDRKSGEHGVWFFGTTLGSIVVYVAKGLWGIPWHYARYQIACTYDQQRKRYTNYRYDVNSGWGNAQIDLEDSGEPVTTLEGFDSPDQMRLILTHPVDGYFYRADQRVGGYSVWHEPIPMTVGSARNLYFGLYERLGLLSRAEMQQPHSVLLCPETDFTVFLPPRVIVPG
jgi:hypothetical protein